MKVKIIISTLITSAFGIFLYLTVTAPKSLAVLDYSAETSDLSNGEYIFTAAGCSGCHIEEGSKDKYLLAGGQKFETAFGTFKAPNISNSVEFGIGAWEFKDFYNALKLGQSPDGEHYFPTFPYTAYSKMTDQDIRVQYGVSYIIRGSIQVMGENARLNLQVSDLKAFEITVAKKKDFNLQDIFKVQDELSNEILQDLSIDLGVGAVQGSNWSEDFKSMEDFVLFLNWREEYRKFNKKSYINALRILEILKPSYVDENVTVSVMEAWQVYQKLILKLSTNKDQDLERLSLIMDRAIELNPKSSDALAAGALIGVDMLNKSCQEAIADIQLAKKLSGTVDTLTTAGIVYERCRDSKNAIKSKRDALNLVPNDNGWFITSSLVFSLYKDNQISEIYSLIGENIEAEDMTARVLALYAFLEQEKGNIEKGKKFLKRAKEKNFSIKKFKMQFRPDQKPLLEKTIAGLTELESLE